MSNKTYYYLYKTTCIITNKFYIGVHKTKNLDDGYLGSGKVLQYSIKKYGKDNHTKEILYWFDNKEDMYSKEKEIVNEKLLNEELCMNIILGGYGGFNDNIRKMSIEKRKHLYQTDENYRNKINEHLKEMNKLSFKNRWKNEKLYIDNLKQLEKMRITSINNRKWLYENDPSYRNKVLENAKHLEKYGGINRNQIMINNGKINKFIKAEELSQYQANNWIKGRIKK
jgi:hypothetical protein